MKKIISLLVALVLVPLAFASIIKASTPSGPRLPDPQIDNNGSDIWHEMVAGQYAFVHMSLPRYNSSDEYVTSYVTSGDHSISFADPGNIWFGDWIWNPNPSLYTIFIIEMRVNENYEVVYYSYDHEFDTIDVNAGSNSIIIQSGENNYQYELIPNERYKIYWSTSITFANQTVSQLPSTTGSPYKNGSYGVVEVNLEAENAVDIRIIYNNNIYELSRKFFLDITPFQNVVKAYYWTDGNDKFISMTYEDKDPVYLPKLGIQANTWTDTVTWNLVTNEIRSVNKVIVYAYHGQESNNNLYTYIYIPNDIFDDIISVTAGFSYYYEYFGGLARSNSEYINKTITKSTGTTTLPWEEKLYLNTIAAVNILVNPIYTIGSLLYTETSWSEGTYEQIEDVQFPSISLVEKMQTAWLNKYNQNVVINTTDNKLYKLNWGQFNKFGTTKVVVEELPPTDPRNFLFAEIVLVKDGSVVVLEGIDIILRSAFDESVRPTPQKPSIWDMLKDLLLEYWWLVAIIVFVLFFNVIVGFVGSLSKLIAVLSTKNGKVAIIVVAVIILVILIQYGIIKI